MTGKTTHEAKIEKNKNFSAATHTRSPIVARAFQSSFVVGAGRRRWKKWHVCDTTYDLLRVRVVLLRLGRGRCLLLHLDGVLFGRLGLLVRLVVQQGHRRLVQCQFRSGARR